MRKGDQTRIVVIDEAANQASVVGLTGLTIGSLAEQTGMSKSGLFAHFKSKEALQSAVMDRVRDLFTANVVAPALKAPRGEPRLRELFERRLAWDEQPIWPGGCILAASTAELDDQPGPARDRLVAAQRDWRDVIARVTRGGITEGHFRDDTDPEQVAFDLLGIFWAWHVHSRLLGEPATARTRAAFDDLLARIRA